MTTAVRSVEQFVASYRRDGFVHVPGVLERDEVGRFRAASEEVASRVAPMTGYRGKPFTRLVNVWRQDDTLAALTRHAAIAAIAERLAGARLRLWHDQLLIKQPQVSTPTEFHLDAPYWPHRGASHWITAWIALVDVPVERGCMTFIPGSHRAEAFAAVDLEDPNALMSAVPELRWQPRVTVPLRAGDLTFHHGVTAHAALPNLTDVPRIAHAVIFMDDGTRFSGAKHVVTDPLGLRGGEALCGELFPPAGPPAR
jgi:ectoine hydroxylase-related dioxygenase (phytanoyl-CoA dioxygenase family)